MLHHSLLEFPAGSQDLEHVAVSRLDEGPQEVEGTIDAFFAAPHHAGILNADSLSKSETPTGTKTVPLYL